MRRRRLLAGAAAVLLLIIGLGSMPSRAQQLTYPAIPGMLRLNNQLVRLVDIPFLGQAPQMIEVMNNLIAAQPTRYSALRLDGGVNNFGLWGTCQDGCLTAQALTIGTDTGVSIVFYTNNAPRWRIVNTTGHFAPDSSSDNTYDIGISGGRARVVRAGNGMYLGSEPGSTVAGMMFFSGVTFASLGTPTNGHVVYCSDCTIAAACAGAGTGALAKRLNGAWVCN